MVLNEPALFKRISSSVRKWRKGGPTTRPFSSFHMCVGIVSFPCGLGSHTHQGPQYYTTKDCDLTDLDQPMSTQG